MTKYDPGRSQDHSTQLAPVDEWFEWDRNYPSAVTTAVWKDKLLSINNIDIRPNVWLIEDNFTALLPEASQEKGFHGDLLNSNSSPSFDKLQ